MKYDSDLYRYWIGKIADIRYYQRHLPRKVTSAELAQYRAALKADLACARQALKTEKVAIRRATKIKLAR